jgi:hypothetical protein
MICLSWKMPHLRRALVWHAERAQGARDLCSS